MLAANFAAGDPAGVGYGLAAWRDVTCVTVPPDLRRDLVVGAGAPKACYSTSLIYAIDHRDHDVTLVHGLVLERGRLWPHAWCEVGGEIVFDPTVGEFLDAASFHEVLQPAVFDTFTPAQAARMAAAEGTAGPWKAREPARYGLVIVGAVGALLEAYTESYPGVLAWIQRMRVADARFAGVLEELERDLLAVPGLLADLVEHPGLWDGHVPGAGPWPYRLCRRPPSARVVHPDT
jgi:hypothetical protein